MSDSAGGRPVAGRATGPPPLRPFGLRLHRDGRFTHEGHPLRNTKLRALFERSVVFLPDEGEAGKYVVRVAHFRGEVEVEEAGFFVRSVDLESGRLELSDGSGETLRGETLAWSLLDADILLCRVKHDLRAGGLPARFEHSAQAELLLAAEEGPAGIAVRLAGDWVVLPDPPT